MDNQTNKLKPCPFCGSEPDVGNNDFVTNYRILSDGLLLAVISCGKCFCEVSASANDPSDGDLIHAHNENSDWSFFDNEIEAVRNAAIAAWNRRAEKGRAK